MVPATTAVRRNRVHNVDSDRLMRRREFLINLLITNHGRTIPTRIMFAMRAAECVAIECELVSRGDLDESDRVSRGTV